jgi:hypothetical protein
VSAEDADVHGRIKLAGLAACFAAGLLAAGVVVGGGIAADTTTTATLTTAEPSTDTAIAVSTESVTVETTVERTTTQRIILPASTSSSESSSSETPAWVWVLLGILAVGLVVLIVLLARRGGHHGPSADERRERLDAAVASWTAQGWALESQTGDSAVLQRHGERMVVNVDAAGQVGTWPVSGAG